MNVDFPEMTPAPRREDAPAEAWRFAEEAIAQAATWNPNSGLLARLVWWTRRQKERAAEKRALERRSGRHRG